MTSPRLTMSQRQARPSLIFSSGTVEPLFRGRGPFVNVGRGARAPPAISSPVMR